MPFANNMRTVFVASSWLVPKVFPKVRMHLGYPGRVSPIRFFFVVSFVASESWAHMPSGCWQEDDETRLGVEHAPDGGYGERHPCVRQRSSKSNSCGVSSRLTRLRNRARPRLVLQRASPPLTTRATSTLAAAGEGRPEDVH